MECPVEGCGGQVLMSTNLRIHFVYLHVRETIEILEGDKCENISNEFQIYFETHFLLLETLLDRNKLTAHFFVKPNSRSEF